MEDELQPIFEKERQAFYRLWHKYHAVRQIPYSHEDKALFFNSLTEIFCEDTRLANAEKAEDELKMCVCDEEGRKMLCSKCYGVISRLANAEKVELDLKHLSMLAKKDFERVSSEGRYYRYDDTAKLIISVCVKFRPANADKLVEALRDLHDAQNGPPLIREEKVWEAAMQKAKQALADFEKGRT